MTNKHIACLIVLFFCILMIQGVLMVHTRAIDMQATAEKALQNAKNIQTTLQTQRNHLDDLKRKSADLLEYLNAWEPYLSQISSPEASQVNINDQLKQVNLLVLAQRFDVVANKTDSSVPNTTNEVVPKIVRASLTTEDDFIKSINLLGNMEKSLPAARVSSLSLVRGQSGNDLRMNLILDVPLVKALATPTPSP